MPSNSKKYLVSLLIVTSLCLLSVALLNYSIDRYNVFSSPTDRVSDEGNALNERVSKFRAFSRQCSKMPAVIFGTSRAQSYRTEFIREFYGMKAYNFAVSMESFHGILMKLKWMTEHECVPELVVVTISGDFVGNYSKDYLNPPYDIRKMEHPDLTSNAAYRGRYLSTYLLSQTVTRINLMSLSSSNAPETYVDYDFTTGDAVYAWDSTFHIERCPKDKFAYDDRDIAKAVGLLREIVSMAKDNGAEVMLLWNPATIENQAGHRGAERFLESISSIVDQVQRIPPSDSRLEDSENFHDASHFKANLAREALLPANRVLVSELIDELDSHWASCAAEESTEKAL